VPVRASVIIVTYNSSGVIRACLASLAADVQAGLLEAIVVDNASADGTPDLVRREFPWAVVIAGAENLGYSKGVNVGIREAHARYCSS
jgi:GT2 family glycosyltransferase